MGGAGIGAAALALAGCSGDEGSLESGDSGGGTTPSATDVPQYGGDEIMGLPADPGGLDVQQSVTGFWCSALMNGYLHSVSTADQTLEPQMAESVEVDRQDDLRLEAPPGHQVPQRRPHVGTRGHGRRRRLQHAAPSR